MEETVETASREEIRCVVGAWAPPAAWHPRVGLSMNRYAGGGGGGKGPLIQHESFSYLVLLQGNRTDFWVVHKNLVRV